MTESDTALFEAIRRDHRAGDRLPWSLAARHGVSRETVLDAVTAVLPLVLQWHFTISAGQRRSVEPSGLTAGQGPVRG
ncbi:hypothetical protein, partial [Streptomyces paromomycinus]|uniref:hypothetical protein n=1 Tax=Streptomyces paromomycinus TaxID=92743 RepID=UPI00340DF09D